jgi:hypothetical protein
MIIVKMGGSIIQKWRELVNVFLEINSTTREKILLIPGGGKIAEIVREMRVDDDNAHWMAIAAMEINGYYLASLGVNRLDPESFDELKPRSVDVLLPYTLSRKNDELPHSWKVTSDSIAIWVAGKLKVKKMEVKEVIKITDVDGIFKDDKLVEEINVKDLSFESCIDAYSPYLIQKFGLDVFICNGNHPKRVKDYILRERALGTLIRGR